MYTEIKQVKNNNWMIEYHTYIQWLKKVSLSSVATDVTINHNSLL